MNILQNERQLVKEAQAGNRKAFEAILDAYESRVYNLACRMVGTRDAEDVAQDALIEICKSIGSFRGKSALSTWVYRVAANVCLEHRRRKRPELVSLEDDFAEYKADPSDDPVTLAVKNQLKSDVDAAIQSLPVIHWDVVVLHELHGLTYQECSEVLGCPVGTVKSRLSHAFVRLRELLKEHAAESGLER